MFSCFSRLARLARARLPLRSLYQRTARPRPRSVHSCCTKSFFPWAAGSRVAVVAVHMLLAIDFVIGGYRLGVCICTRIPSPALAAAQGGNRAAGVMISSSASRRRHRRALPRRGDCRCTISLFHTLLSVRCICGTLMAWAICLRVTSRTSASSLAADPLSEPISSQRRSILELTASSPHGGLVGLFCVLSPSTSRRRAGFPGVRRSRR